MRRRLRCRHHRRRRSPARRRTVSLGIGRTRAACGRGTTDSDRRRPGGPCSARRAGLAGSYSHPEHRCRGCPRHAGGRCSSLSGLRGPSRGAAQQRQQHACVAHGSHLRAANARGGARCVIRLGTHARSACAARTRKLPSASPHQLGWVSSPAAAFAGPASTESSAKARRAASSLRRNAGADASAAPEAQPVASRFQRAV